MEIISTRKQGVVALKKGSKIYTMLQSIDLISITQIRDLDFRNRVSHRVVFFLLFLLKSRGPTQ